MEIPIPLRMAGIYNNYLGTDYYNHADEYFIRLNP